MTRTLLSTAELIPRALKLAGQLEDLLIQVAREGAASPPPSKGTPTAKPPATTTPTSNATPVRGLRPVHVPIVVGHNARSGGAYSKVLGMSEYQFNNQVAEEMVRLAPDWMKIRSFPRTYTSSSYSQRTAAAYRKVNAWENGGDLCLELHFNAYNGKADYTAMYVAHAASSRSVRLAQILADRFSTHLGTPNKGVIKRGPSERGGKAMVAARAPMVLTEPFFGDHAPSAQTVQDLGGPKWVAWAYVDALVRFCIAEGWAEVEE